ncbi:rRNA maturation RNase YbeY [Petrachloros mirabilis]
MTVLLKVHVRSVTIHRRRLLRLAQILLSAVGESSAEVGLLLVGDYHMRRLNRQYRRKDRTTDVLAFAMREAVVPRSARLARAQLGDIVISVPTAVRQAREGRRSPDAELTALLVHGILHLCGYDHERGRAEARRMQRREQTLLRKVGRIPCLIGVHRKTTPRTLSFKKRVGA